MDDLTKKAVDRLLEREMSARYPGRCPRCGGDINIGDKINWEPGKRASHIRCPEPQVEPAPSSVAPRAQPQSATVEGPYRLSGGSGYGDAGWDVGQTVRNPDRRPCKKGEHEWGMTEPSEMGKRPGIQPKPYCKKCFLLRSAYDDTGPEYVTVVTTGQRYYREDGMSFGVGDQSGYAYWATARAATEDEMTPLRAQEDAQRQRRDAATVRSTTLRALEQEVRERGERPEGSNSPEGERWFDTQTIYGGGSWWVVGPDYIWFVLNNGADGDDWSLNNVRTGGAGAIGWRAPRSEDLLSRLSALRTAAGKGE